MPKAGDKDKHAALSRANVLLVPQGVIITVSKTKTIQCGERLLKIPLHRNPDSPLCPVTALQAIWELPALSSDQPLFSFLADGGIQILDYKTFTDLFRTTIAAAGIDSSLYSGHSLRRGGATYAFKCGVPAAYIKLQGDWLSDAWERYIHLPLELRWKLAESMVA